MKNIVKTGAVLLMLTIALAPAVTSAQVDWGIGYAEDVGLGTQEIRTVAVQVVQALLGLLGIIALIIILIGGFRWMTAGGNEENVAAAKKTIAAGIVGLIIIFFAYAIVLFIFNVVGSAV